MDRRRKVRGKDWLADWDARKKGKAKGEIKEGWKKRRRSRRRKEGVASRETDVIKGKERWIKNESKKENIYIKFDEKRKMEEKNKAK